MSDPKASSSTPAVRPGAPVSQALQQSFCRFKHHPCGMPRLDGYDFCSRHILEDKQAPYKQCSYVYHVNGQQCNQAAYRGERRSNGYQYQREAYTPSPSPTFTLIIRHIHSSGSKQFYFEEDDGRIRYCVAHARKEQLKRQKSALRRYPPQTPESLLAGLAHYAKYDPPSETTPQNQTNETAGEVEDKTENDPSAGSRALNPFVDMNATKINASASRILDYASESDSDVDAAVLDSTWKGADADADSSDAESVDSQQEDLLKHAGVYTSEEAMSVTKEKLLRLQSLYIEQFRRLQHILRERRRKYLHAVKKEKESLCSISSQAKTSAREQKLYAKLKALNRYHRRNGVEAVLHKKAMERRASVTEGVPGRPSHFPKCIYTEGGVKCGVKTLPVAKFCMKHILHDTNQILFRPCGCQKGADYECHEPLPDIFEDASCVYHTTLAPIKIIKVEKTEILPEPEQQVQAHLEEALCLEANMPDKLDISAMEIVMGTTESVEKSTESSMPQQEQWLM